MALMMPIDVREEYFGGVWLKFTVVRYAAASDTVSIDPTCQGTAVAFHLEGGTAPNVAVGASIDSTTKQRTLTVGGSTAGTFGRILIITQHGQSLSGHSFAG
jgi:hypothetical protein